MQNGLKALLYSKKDPTLSFGSGKIQKVLGGCAVCFVAGVSTVRLQQLRKSPFPSAGRLLTLPEEDVKSKVKGGMGIVYISLILRLWSTEVFIGQPLTPSSDTF